MRHEPEESATGHCGLDEKHVCVCDMAQNPVHRRAVVRSSIHTEPDNTALAEECASWWSVEVVVVRWSLVCGSGVSGRSFLLGLLWCFGVWCLVLGKCTANVGFAGTGELDGAGWTEGDQPHQGRRLVQ